MSNLLTRLGRLGWIVGGLGVLAAVAAVVLTVEATAADSTPLTIHFQGRLVDASGNPVTGSRDMAFRYYSVATAGTLLYVETRSAANLNAVAVTQGNYAVALGGGTYVPGEGPLYVNLKSVFQNQTSVWLELQVASEAVMTPRLRILAAGYAVNTDLLDGLDSTQYMKKAGDTMAGVLALPANGLSAGADQLVLSGGKVGVGTTAPVATLDVGGTGAVKIPVGTTAQSPASPAAGMLRGNTDTGSLEFFDGTSWKVTAVEVPFPVASGGTETTIIDEGLAYKIHTFNAGGTFTVTTAGYVEVLVVAGGGSGGNHNTTNGNGGGGGGGVIYQKSYQVTPQAYSVTVGAGGAAIGFQVVSHGNNGGNSVFGTLTALGGGGGGSSGGGTAAYIAQNGGCGGGGAYGWYSCGVSTQRDGFGNSGGQAYRAYSGGGGGGAGSAAPAGVVNGETAPGGNGGRGLGCSITGTLFFYAGGGGGGGNSSERAGDGWDGGGRGFGTTSFYDYNTYPVGTNSATGGSSTPHALPNTGGGGGAGSYWSNNSTGWAGSQGSGAGGSGVVIIRYRVQ